MRWMIVPRLMAVASMLLPCMASGHVVRHNSVPQALWGRWLAASASCTDAGTAALVLSAKAYVGPAGNCAVESVSETPGEHGPTYSARLQCGTTAAGAQKKSVANLIVRPDGAERLSIGTSFDNLAPYQRCGAGGADAKQ